MNATALVLKAMHYETTVRESPLGWTEEKIKEKGNEKYWRFDVNTLVINTSRDSIETPSYLWRVDGACIIGKGILECSFLRQSSKTIVEAEKKDSIGGYCKFYKFLGLPDSYKEFRPKDEVEMELSFAFFDDLLFGHNYVPPIISNYDQHFRKAFPLAITIYIDMDSYSGITGRKKTKTKEVTTNFISYPKTNAYKRHKHGKHIPDSLSRSADSGVPEGNLQQAAGAFEETEIELTEEQKQCQDLIELFGTDNGAVQARCSNEKCRYQREVYIGISGIRPERGFFVPGFCENCNEIVSVSDVIPKCEDCGRKVKRYIHDKNFVEGRADFLTQNLPCPKCGQNTLIFDLLSGPTWD